MEMRRLLFLFAFAITVPAFALTRSPRPGDRIAVLRMSEQFSYGADQTVARAVQNDLRRELRALGFDAFDARATWEELSHQGRPNADFLVEIVSSQAMSHPVAGGGVAAGAMAVDVAMVVARVAAEVRLYDARTFNEIARFDLHNNNAAVLPTAIGIGGRSVWAFFAIPFVQYGQYRAAAHAVARQAASRIASQ